MTNTSQRRRLFKLASLVAVVALVGAVSLEVTTKQGLNYEVSTHRIPLYLKALQFIDRSVQYRQISQEVTRNAVSDEDRALRVFEWTRRHIKPTPPGWPIVDDHILNIVIRGYGMNDQQADVFATLATYAGVPAFWAKVPGERAGKGVILSFARVDGRWRVFDVSAGIIFRDAAGELATMADLKGHSELVPALAQSTDVGGVPYAEVVTTASLPPVPDPLRAEMQMPSARLWHELKVVLRFASP